MKNTNVPFFRPDIKDEEINEVVDALRSGWITTGPKVKTFEVQFAETVNARNAVAVNSCTAALHLAAEAIGLQAGEVVLVPTMTFAATAEIALYKNAVPLLVDCDYETGNLDLADARRKIAALRAGEFSGIAEADAKIAGIIPVHVGGYMMNIEELKSFAAEFGLWIIEDAAHSFPAAWRKDSESEWQFCGENTADVTCFSFYANKTITTGEGGMATTGNDLLAEKIRLLSLHGLSRDAWKRYSEKGNWDYRIIAPGYKYNLTDIAAAIGVHQLARAEEMRKQRARIAEIYNRRLKSVEEIRLPLDDENRLHSWHLYALRLDLSKLSVTRNEFIENMTAQGIGSSVHWRPLHLHPLYQEKFGWKADHFPAANRRWEELVSLPIFSAMRDEEVESVAATLENICRAYRNRLISQVV